MSNERFEAQKAKLGAWVKDTFGKDSTLENFKYISSEVRTRKGTKFERHPGDRLRVIVDVSRNIEGRPSGFFIGEDGHPGEISKDDVIQVNEFGPADLIGTLYQVSEAHAWGVRAFSVASKKHVRLETGQFDRIGRAALVTASQHDTEPMDHKLNKEGEVVHETERKKQETAPMAHAVNKDIPIHKAVTKRADKGDE